MRFEKVVIKQIPDEESGTASGLGRYKRSRFPKCVDVFCAAPLPDGRFLTGINPDGYEVLLVKDPVLRSEKKHELEELNESFKRILPNVDLSPTSDFWRTFSVSISTDQDLVLNRANPHDVLKYHLLVENGYAAPSLDEIGNPRYRECKYYCHIDEVEAREKVSTQKLRDRATAELSKISENKDYMLLLGKYLEGTKYKDKMLPDTVYTNLSMYVHDSANPDNVEKFLKAVKLPIEDLQFKVTVDIALRKKIIRYQNGQYTRGGVNLGRTPTAVLENLKLPDFAVEFLQINDEVNSR